jgi:hypothetical protein
MHISLGRCHYGGNDAATMTGVHPERTGWIAVCASHAARAEDEGYRLHEHADLFADPYPDDPAPSSPVLTPAASAEARRTRAAADWEQLEAILDSDD